jgi:hypothetical protein
MSVEVGSWVEAADTISQLKGFKSLSGISVSSVTESEREVTADKASYYVDGVLVDSLDDVDLVDADGNAKVVTVLQEGETVTEKYYSFSVTCTWTSIEDLKLLDASGNEAEPAESVENTENTEGGAES